MRGRLARRAQPTGRPKKSQGVQHAQQPGSEGTDSARYQRSEPGLRGERGREEPNKSPGVQNSAAAWERSDLLGSVLAMRGRLARRAQPTGRPKKSQGVQHAQQPGSE